MNAPLPGHGADNGAVDASEAADGDHDDEEQADDDPEVLGAEKLRVEREQPAREPGELASGCVSGAGE